MPECSGKNASGMSWKNIPRYVPIYVSSGLQALFLRPGKGMRLFLFEGISRAEHDGHGSFPAFVRGCIFAPRGWRVECCVMGDEKGTESHPCLFRFSVFALVPAERFTLRRIWGRRISSWQGCTFPFLFFSESWRFRRDEHWQEGRNG